MTTILYRGKESIIKYQPEQGLYPFILYRTKTARVSDDHSATIEVERGRDPQNPFERASAIIFSRGDQKTQTPFAYAKISEILATSEQNHVTSACVFENIPYTLKVILDDALDCSS